MLISFKIARLWNNMQTISVRTTVVRLLYDCWAIDAIKWWEPVDEHVVTRTVHHYVPLFLSLVFGPTLLLHMLHRPPITRRLFVILLCATLFLTTVKDTLMDSGHSNCCHLEAAITCNHTTSGMDLCPSPRRCRCRSSPLCLFGSRLNNQW